MVHSRSTKCLLLVCTLFLMTVNESEKLQEPTSRWTSNLALSPPTLAQSSCQDLDTPSSENCSSAVEYSIPPLPPSLQANKVSYKVVCSVQHLSLVIGISTVWQLHHECCFFFLQKLVHLCICAYPDLLIKLVLKSAKLEDIIIHVIVIKFKCAMMINMIWEIWFVCASFHLGEFIPMHWVATPPSILHWV